MHSVDWIISPLLAKRRCKLCIAHTPSTIVNPFAISHLLREGIAFSLDIHPEFIRAYLINTASDIPGMWSFSVAVSRDKKLSFSTFETPFDLSRFTNKVSLDIKDGARDWDVHSNACKIIYLCIKPFLRTYERNSKRNLYID